MYFITLLNKCIQIHLMGHHFYENHFIIEQNIPLCQHVLNACTVRVEAMCQRNHPKHFRGVVYIIVGCVVQERQYLQLWFYCSGR